LLGTIDRLKVSRVLQQSHKDFHHLSWCTPVSIEGIGEQLHERCSCQHEPQSCFSEGTPSDESFVNRYQAAESALFGGARGDWLTRSAKFPRGLNGGFTLVNWLRRVANQKIRTPALILGGSPCKQNQPIYADQDPAGWPLQAVRVIRVK
jgi:hypothetical protein